VNDRFFIDQQPGPSRCHSRFCDHRGVEVRQIEYFVAVAEVLNFGRAAERLGLGQPGVSQQVARLEREFGVLLFDRSARAIRLTEAGQRFLPEARAVLTAIERARAAAVGGGEEQLRLGSSTGLGQRLTTVLAELQQASIEVELVSAPTRTRLERVRAGQLDASFVRGVESAPGLELIPVWQDSLLVALPAAHPIAAQQQVELRQLKDLALRITSRRNNPPLVDLVMGACAEAGFEPLLGQRSQNLQDTLASIGAGSPSWTVLYAAQAQQLRQAQVVFRPLDPPLTMETSLAVPEGTTVSGGLAVLLGACREAALNDCGE
jgi:DNA-binding transcriptional LysR family regulator